MDRTVYLRSLQASNSIAELSSSSMSRSLCRIGCKLYCPCTPHPGCLCLLSSSLLRYFYALSVCVRVSSLVLLFPSFFYNFLLLIRMTPINAASRPPSFGRRVAAKVTSLIAKFEAMSAAPNAQTRRKITPPRKRTLGSVVTPGGSSLSRRSTLRKSIGKKARIFVKLDWEKENANRHPAKVAPPPKRILKASRSITNPKGRRRVTLPIGNPASTTKRRRSLSGTFNCYSLSRYNADDEKSGITLDGPAFGPDTSSGSSTLRSTPAASTPPVARILPSSFFSQLVAPDLPLKDTPRIRVFTDSEDSDLLIVEKRHRIDYRQFRLTSVDKQKSVWRRKITPPKISVKELISLFRPEEAVVTRNVQVPVHSSPPPGLSEASVESSGDDESVASSADTPLTLSPAVSVTSSGSQRPPQDSIAGGNGMQDLVLSGSEVGTTGSTIGSSFASSLGRSLTSSQRSTVGRRALANVGVNVVPPPLFYWLCR
jgi:hypothetical protein